MIHREPRPKRSGFFHVPKIVKALMILCLMIRTVMVKAFTNACTTEHMFAPRTAPTEHTFARTHVRMPTRPNTCSHEHLFAPPTEHLFASPGTFRGRPPSVGGLVTYFLWGWLVCVMSGFCVEDVLYGCGCDCWLCFLGFVL